MNIDLTPLTSLLASLGPWGIVAAIVITAAAPKILAAIKARFPGLKLPGTSPSTPATPAPVDTPATAPTSRPVIDWLLAAIKARLAAKNPAADPEQLLASYLVGHAVGIALPSADPVPTAPDLRAG